MPSDLAGRPLRIGLVAAELSGDQLGAALIRAIRAANPQARFEGIAGPGMREAGCKALAGTEQLSVMGLAEVLRRLPGLVRIRRNLLHRFIDKPPDVFIGIDGPDFNLPLERKLKAKGIPTVHLVSPSVWAWRQRRMKDIGRSVDLMLTLFPFEKPYYDEAGIPARYIGHPLADSIPDRVDKLSARRSLGLDAERPGIALLPGSRASEVKRLLPLFLDTARLCARQLKDVQFVLPVATAALEPLCRQWAGKPEYAALQPKLLQGKARLAMQAADVVLLASGTAALECMLLKRPMVVSYRLHPLSYFFVKRMLRVPFVSLPNHLLGRAHVPEFLQQNANPEAMAQKLLELTLPESARQQVEPFLELHRQLRQNAAQQAAQYILEKDWQ